MHEIFREFLTFCPQYAFHGLGHAYYYSTVDDSSNMCWNHVRQESCPALMYILGENHVKSTKKLKKS